MCQACSRPAHLVLISDGAVFKHFETKDAIVDAAIDLFQSVLSSPKPDPAAARRRTGKLTADQTWSEVVAVIAPHQDANGDKTS